MVSRSLRRSSSRFIGSDLISQMVQSREVVFNLLISGQCRLTIARNAFVISCPRLLIERSACTEVEQWHLRRGPGGPESARRLEPSARLRAFVTCGTA